MDLEKKVEQLIDLMADLIPTVDQMAKNEEATSRAIERLIKNEEATSKAIEHLIKNEEATSKAIEHLIKNEEATNKSISKLNLALGEMRQSNLRMINVLEHLERKIDGIEEFEKRLKILEDKVL
ncbi:MAG: hypothetical protein AAGC64_03265 [Bacteroidota bacterium]